jgi:hypothetical protein
MIVTSMQLTISSRRDIAVLRKESSSVEGEEDVKEDFILLRRNAAFVRGALLGPALPVGLRSGARR